MKLRIRANTLRFRLGRSEVKDFGRVGTIVDKVRFGSGEADFGYSLEKTSAGYFSASFRDCRIVVYIPAAAAEAWADSDEVSLSGVCQPDEYTEIKILIEKDFVCLNAHNDEDQSDRYPNPKGPNAC